MKYQKTAKRVCRAKVFTGGLYLFMLTAVLSLGACRGYHAAPEVPPFKVPASFSASGDLPLNELWWHEIDDPVMWNHVEYALGENFTVKSAYQRIKAAEAQVKRARAPLFPWLDLGAGLGHTTRKEGSSYINEDNILINSSVSYELDLWGRINSEVKASELDLSAQRADFETARLTLSSQVAIKYFEIVALKQEIKIIGRQEERNRKSLDIIRDKYNFGQTDPLDLWQQEQLVEQTISKQIEAEKALETAQKELALLLGRTATKSGDIKTSESLPRLPPLPETGLPVKILKRRPDCMRALKRLMAANKRLAAAVTAQYPRLTLDASMETDSSAVKDLLENWVSTLSSSLVAPVFEGGRLQADVLEKEARARKLLYDYGQTLLTAIKEVEESLAFERHQQELIGNLESRLELAKKTSLLLKEKYLAGDVEYLRFLASQLSVDELERQLVQERFRLIQNRIRLYKALGGPVPLASPRSKGKSTAK